MSVIVYKFLLLLLSGIALSEETTTSNVNHLNETSNDNGTIYPLLLENPSTNIGPDSLNGTNSTGSLGINGTFPFQASIYLNYNDEFVCGGQIISNNTILTLASCLYYEWGGVLPPIIVKVLVGRISLVESAAYSLEAEKIIFYSLFSEETLENNLAIIQLKNTLQFTSTITNATVNTTTTTFGAYNTCVASGWSTTTNEIQEIAVTIVNCSQSFSSTKMCAQSTLSNETICDHALGGSLVCDGDLVGILSTLPTCNDTNSVAVFERLSSAIAWLKSNNVGSSAASFMTVPLKKVSMYNLFILLPLIATMIVGALLQA